MIKPQHFKKTATMSQLIDHRISRKQKHIDHIIEEYHNIFQEPNREPLHCQVKYSIELVPSSSLPNTFFYRRSMIENEDIHRQIQYLINKGHIQPNPSPCGIPVILIPKKDGTWRM